MWSALTASWQHSEHAAVCLSQQRTRQYIPTAYPIRDYPHVLFRGVARRRNYQPMLIRDGQACELWPGGSLNCAHKKNCVACVRERTIPTERSPFVGEVSADFADRGCHVVSVTDPYGRILGFLDRNRFCFFQVAPKLYSRGWVDPVPDSLLLWKSGSAGNRTRTSGSVAILYSNVDGRISAVCNFLSRIILSGRYSTCFLYTFTILSKLYRSVESSYIGWLRVTDLKVCGMKKLSRPRGCFSISVNGMRKTMKNFSHERRLPGNKLPWDFENIEKERCLFENNCRCCSITRQW
jgi:hypothetical protein